MFLFQVYWLAFLKMFSWHVSLRQLWIIQVGYSRMMLWFGSILSDLAAPVIKVYWWRSSSHFWPYFGLQRKELINLSPENCIHSALETEGSNKQAEVSMIFLLSMAWTVCVTHQVRRIIVVLLNHAMSLPYYCYGYIQP